MRTAMIEEGELQLWVLSPRELDAAAQSCAGALAPHESDWAAAMPEGLGRRWRGRRAALRTILSAYLGRPAPDIAIVPGAYGKPRLDAREGALQFNLSESCGWMLAAFCPDQPVGVDLELGRPDAGAWTVARRYFSEPELAVLEAAERAGRLEAAFFRLWTRKEARLKVWGQGLRGLEALAEEGLFTPESRAWIEDLNPAMGVYGAVALPLAPTWMRVRSYAELDALASSLPGQAFERVL
jgi:4'-phosphopantetheinyl transferase